MVNLDPESFDRGYENACLNYNQGEFARGKRLTRFPTADDLRHFQLHDNFPPRSLEGVYINTEPLGTRPSCWNAQPRTANAGATSLACPGIVVEGILATKRWRL